MSDKIKLVLALFVIYDKLRKLYELYQKILDLSGFIVILDY